MGTVLFDPEKFIEEAERLVTEYPISEDELLDMMRLGAALAKEGVRPVDLVRQLRVADGQ